ncbi:MAG: hypothetical protein ABI082_13095 [Dokdonella sp.]
MLRRLVLAAALAASPLAFAQQNVDISGANLSSGKADATLAALGRKAAATGNQLVITAPPEWHAKIEAKVHAGGNASIVMRDGFYENVLVRVEPKGAAIAEPEKAVAKAEVEKSKAQAEKAKAEADKSRAEADKAKAEAEKAIAEAETAKAQAEAAKARQAAQTAAAKPAPVAAAAAPAPAAPAAATPTTAGNSVDAIHARLEEALKGGRAADGTLTPDKLQSNDTLYVDGPVRAVTRREGSRMGLYWVEGNLDLRRSELRLIAPDRYQVLSPIRGEGTLRRETGASVVSLDAREPAANAPARLTLEKSLNDGRSISDTIAPARLRSGDIIYSNESAAVVVRRTDKSLTRYWLVGTLDLTQVGLQADGDNKYKVLADTIR